MTNEDVHAFIAQMQADPTTATAYLPSDQTALEEALEATDWSSTARTLREGEQVVACVFLDHDEDQPRTWVLGPWVGQDQPDRVTTAVALVLAMAQQVAGTDPSSTLEMLADVRNTLVSETAASLGWDAPYLEQADGVTVADYRGRVTS